VTQLKDHSGCVRSITYSSDGKQLALGRESYKKGGLHIWDTQTLQTVTRLKGHKYSTSCVIYSPNGNQLAFANSSTIWILDKDTWQAITQLEGHLSSVNSVAYSQDGKQLASASADHSVFLWAKQSTACLPKPQESWQLICRFESSHRLYAEGAFLKGAKVSENNFAPLKQRGANNKKDLLEHIHTPAHPKTDLPEGRPNPSLVMQEKSRRNEKKDKKQRRSLEGVGISNLSLPLHKIENDDQELLVFAATYRQPDLTESSPRSFLVAQEESRKSTKTHKQEKSKKPKKTRKKDYQPSPEDEANKEKCLVM
jgi:hypothetical protein